MKAQMQNAKVNNATGALVVMRSVEPGPNPQVPINQPIPNFPASPDVISQMNGTLTFQRFFFVSRLAELTNVLRRGPMSHPPNIP
jgi:hypothetical protein